MRLIVWLLRAAVFFTLFAFALNNLHTVEVHWFFGYQWRAPMVFIVLAAFALGCAFGILAMMPRWWRKRRELRAAQPPLRGETATETALEPLPEHPPRDGL